MLWDDLLALGAGALAGAFLTSPKVLSIDSVIGTVEDNLDLYRSLRRSGTSAPMPPICMPMEPRLAKPQRAKVAMEKVRGVRVCFQRPSWV